MTKQQGTKAYFNAVGELYATHDAEFDEYGRCRICRKPCPFDHDVPEEEIVCDVCAGAPEDEVDW